MRWHLACLTLCVCYTGTAAVGGSYHGGGGGHSKNSHRDRLKDVHALSTAAHDGIHTSTARLQTTQGQGNQTRVSEVNTTAPSIYTSAPTNRQSINTESTGASFITNTQRSTASTSRKQNTAYIKTANVSELVQTTVNTASATTNTPHENKTVDTMTTPLPSLDYVPLYNQDDAPQTHARNLVPTTVDTVSTRNLVLVDTTTPVAATFLGQNMSEFPTEKLVNISEMTTRFQETNATKIPTVPQMQNAEVMTIQAETKLSVTKTTMSTVQTTWTSTAGDPISSLSSVKSASVASTTQSIVGTGQDNTTALFDADYTASTSSIVNTPENANRSSSIPTIHVSIDPTVLVPDINTTVGFIEQHDTKGTVIDMGVSIPSEIEQLNSSLSEIPEISENDTDDVSGDFDPNMDDSSTVTTAPEIRNVETTTAQAKERFKLIDGRWVNPNFEGDTKNQIFIASQLNTFKLFRPADARNISNRLLIDRVEPTNLNDRYQWLLDIETVNGISKLHAIPIPDQYPQTVERNVSLPSDNVEKGTVDAFHYENTVKKEIIEHKSLSFYVENNPNRITVDVALKLQPLPKAHTPTFEVFFSKNDDSLANPSATVLKFVRALKQFIGATTPESFVMTSYTIDSHRHGANKHKQIAKIKWINLDPPSEICKSKLPALLSKDTVLRKFNHSEQAHFNRKDWNSSSRKKFFALLDKFGFNRRPIFEIRAYNVSSSLKQCYMPTTTTTGSPTARSTTTVRETTIKTTTLVTESSNGSTNTSLDAVSGTSRNDTSVTTARDCSSLSLCPGEDGKDSGHGHSKIDSLNRASLPTDFIVVGLIVFLLMVLLLIAKFGQRCCKPSPAAVVSDENSDPEARPLASSGDSLPEETDVKCSTDTVILVKGRSGRDSVFSK